MDKIRNKSKAYWKHGKHKGMQGYLQKEKRSKKYKGDITALDLSKSNWSN